MSVSTKRFDRLVDRWFRSTPRPRQASYLIIAFWLIAIVVFGVIERILDPETFPTIWLAFWWALQTVTTVGYGDIVPGDTAGKAMAAVLMLGGLSLLSIITATIASSFVTRRQAQMRATGEDPVVRQLNELAASVARVEAELRALRGANPGEQTEPDARIE